MNASPIHDLLFFRLLRTALQTEAPESWQVEPSVEEWRDAYHEAKRQCLLGVAFEGIKRLKEAFNAGRCATDWTANLDEDLWLVWIGRAQQIATENGHLNEQCKQLTTKFVRSNKWCRVIKGQASASLYPNPASRECGDIDIWVAAAEAFDAQGNYSLSRNREALVQMVRRLTKHHGEVMYHHTDFPVFPDTEVEVHFTPSWMYSPLHNSRLQSYFKAQMLKMRTADLASAAPSGPASEPHLQTLDAETNVVYNLVHIFRHVLGEGIGMRQIVDYFYILRQWQAECNASGRSADLSVLLNRLGLRHFARGLMALMHHTLGMSAECFIAAPDENLGRWLLEQVLLSGNFGHDDKRLEDFDTSRRKDRIRWHFIHSFSLVGKFPRETLCDPFWRLWHYIWRSRHGYL